MFVGQKKGLQNGDDKNVRIGLLGKDAVYEVRDADVQFILDDPERVCPLYREWSVPNTHY